MELNVNFKFRFLNWQIRNILLRKSRKNIIKINNYHPPMEKNLSAFDKTQICESQIDHAQPFNSFQKTTLTPNPQEKCQKKQQNKNSMDTFCHQFYSDYSLKTNQIITIKDITDIYKIKSRRVYELMSILQGLSYVYKMKKVGHYMWIGTQSKQLKPFSSFEKRGRSFESFIHKVSTGTFNNLIELKNDPLDLREDNTEAMQTDNKSQDILMSQGNENNGYGGEIKCEFQAFKAQILEAITGDIRFAWINEGN